MAYLVMARKWRPRNFDEMVGQEHIARTLRNAIEGKRIAHAYLFTGTRGVGKTTSARILAKALNCEKGPTPTPCDACDNCKAVSAGTSMDVLEIDGASNRGVNEIRELREQVKYAPMQGAFKVYIIDEVHMLTKEAFNALLKTLEEPPPHVVFLFATTEVNKVPHTILSRVQRFDFKRISEPQIRGRLEFICSQEGITFESEALEAIARKADGSMRDGLSLFDQVLAFSGTHLSLEDARRILGLPPDELFGQLLTALVSHDAAACYALIDRVMGEGIELGEFLLGFGAHLRDMLFARQEGMAANALGFSENRFRELRSSQADLRDGDLIRYGKIVSDLLGGMKQAAHPRLHVEMGLLRMAALDRIATLSQLMQSNLAREAAQGNAGETSATSQISEALKKKNPVTPNTVTNHRPEASQTHPNPEVASPDIQVGTHADSNSKTVPVSSPSSTRLQEASEEEPEREANNLPSGMPSETLQRASHHRPDTSPTLEPNPLPDFEPDSRPGQGNDESYSNQDETDYSTRRFDDEDGDLGMERDLDLDPDLLPAAHQAAPVQNLQFDSFDSLAQNWALVLQDVLAEPSLMAIHLGGSRLSLSAHENPSHPESASVEKPEGDAAPETVPLRLELAHQVAHEFFLANTDARKKFTVLIQSRLRNSENFSVEYVLKAADASDNTPAAVTPGLRRRLSDEPIVQTLIQLFDGRVLVNAGH